MASGRWSGCRGANWTAARDEFDCTSGAAVLCILTGSPVDWWHTWWWYAGVPGARLDSRHGPDGASAEPSGQDSAHDKMMLDSSDNPPSKKIKTEDAVKEEPAETKS